MEVVRPFDILLCRRDALAALGQVTILKTARLSTGGSFNIPNFARVHYLCFSSSFIENVSFVPTNLSDFKLLLQYRQEETLQ